MGGAAPLNGAVVANGAVKVDGNRKSVQHLDGGIVKELRTKEGDRIKAESRTAFDYLVGPLMMSFKHAFRQK